MKNKYLLTTILAAACLSSYAEVANAATAKKANNRANSTEQQVLNKNGIKVKVSTGFDYSTGDYGQTEDTEVWYVPVSGKVEVDKWTFKLTVPWLSIRGPGAVIGGGGGSVVTGGGGAVTTESGLGDIVTSLGYTIDVAPQTYLDLTGKIKLPTADENKGLGTGETDYTLQADLSKQFGALSIYGGAAYKFIGTNATLNLNNGWAASVGFGYDVTKSVNVGAAYDWKQASSDTGENPSEVSLSVNLKATDNINIQAYALTGFSDGSPNAGGGMMVGYKF